MCSLFYQLQWKYIVSSIFAVDNHHILIISNNHRQIDSDMNYPHQQKNRMPFFTHFLFERLFDFFLEFNIISWITQNCPAAHNLLRCFDQKSTRRRAMGKLTLKNKVLPYGNARQIRTNYSRNGAQFNGKNQRCNKSIFAMIGTIHLLNLSRDFYARLPSQFHLSRQPRAWIAWVLKTIQHTLHWISTKEYTQNIINESIVWDCLYNLYCSWNCSIV